MCGHCSCGQPAALEGSIPDISSAATASAHPGRSVSLEESLLARNDHLAAHNRDHFRAAGVRVVNLLSSPGSGKTALLERLPALVRPGLRLAALVGDLATDNDARRLREAGLPTVQITTGQACHLEAAMVHRGLEALAAAGHPLEALDLLLIENVGNLVCPAAFDLGEDLRLVLLSVTEGEDKPLKYPATFHSAALVVISKGDLAEAVGFDRPLALRHIQQVAPHARVLEVSARTGTGLEALLASLLDGVAATPTGPAG
jgi:hydrogenase nickel incorporation protein HypB